MGYQLFFRSTMLVVFASTILGGMALDNLSAKICAAILGAASVGFLGALRIRFFKGRDAQLLRALSENIRETRKLLRDSSYGVSRKAMRLESVNDDAFGTFDVPDTLMHPLFIFTVLSVAMMMFFTPSFGEFVLGRDANHALAWKSFGVHSLTFLLLAGGCTGIALRIFFLVTPTDRSG